MCAQHTVRFPSWMGMAVAMLIGLGAGISNIPQVMVVADTLSTIFIHLLQMVSLPIIFLSIVSTASGMGSLSEIRSLGKYVISYTLLTTVIAASVALTIYMTVNPAHGNVVVAIDAAPVEASGSYLNYLVAAIPSNIVRPFVDNNVIGVFFLAALLSVAILALPNENKSVLHGVFSSLFAAVMKVTGYVVRLMPIAVSAFVALFVRDVSAGLEVNTLAWYLFCVVAANLVQAFIVLPTLLKLRGGSPVRTFKAMMPALSLAFFSKSSSAALPMAMKCAEERLNLPRRVTSFSLPLCTTINMNACAAFILTTVLFVSMSNGMVYSVPEMILWVLIATVAAVGNAGVPMGCYFLSSALLAGMGVPLNILAVILPFYTLIDMLESAINVWSDACVTAMVAAEVGDTAPATAKSC